MDRTIAVLNAGSSSLKFSIFFDHSGELRMMFRGQAEGLFTSPRFLVRDRAGATVAETEWPEGTRLGHEGAIEHLFRWAAEVKARQGGRRLDPLVFTAGIGEHWAAIRARVCRDAAWLGATLDEAANEAGGPRISREGGKVSAWVIPTNEELIMARHTNRLTAV